MLHPGVHTLSPGPVASILVAVMSLVRTNAAAQLLGISPSTLRTWERRYGFPVPARTPGGHRQYEVAVIEQLAGAFARTGNASSAVALVRDGDGAPSSAPDHALARAFAAFDEALADRAADEALAARGLERTVAELVLPGVCALDADAPEHALAQRWAAGWLAAQRRLAPPASRPQGVLLLDCAPAGTDDGLAGQALELVLRRIGLRVLALPIALDPDRLGRAVRALDPAVAVLCGSGGDLDAVGRIVFATRRASGDRIALCDFGGALPRAGGSTVPRLPTGLLDARDELLARAEGRAIATPVRRLRVA